MPKRRTKGSVGLGVNNRCYQNGVHHRPIYNLLYRSVGYILVDNSHLHPTPQAPLNHSDVCLCDLMFGQVLSGGYIRE